MTQINEDVEPLNEFIDEWGVVDDISVRPDCVGPLLQAIYNTEWPIRLEYVWDAGWTWVLVGHNGPSGERRFPRVWFDDQMQGEDQIVWMSEHARTNYESIPVQGRDWVARGSEDSIELAVGRLASELSKRLPDSSSFKARWNKGEWLKNDDGRQN